MRVKTLDNEAPEVGDLVTMSRATWGDTGYYYEVKSINDKDGTAQLLVRWGQTWDYRPPNPKQKPVKAELDKVKVVEQESLLKWIMEYHRRISADLDAVDYLRTKVSLPELDWRPPEVIGEDYYTF